MCKSESKILTILNDDIPDGYVDSAYQATIYAVGGNPVKHENGENQYYRWCVDGLPDGINSDPSTAKSINCENKDTNNWAELTINEPLRLNGTPTKSNNYKIRVFVADSLTQTKKEFVITINPNAQSGNSP